MKKFLLFAILIASFTFVNAYLIEKVDVLKVKDITPEFSFTEENGHVTMHWNKLPYPCIYKIDTYSKTTGMVKDEPEYHLFSTEYTTGDHIQVADSAVPMFYEVTAYGLFSVLGGPYPHAANPDFPNPVMPVSIFHYTDEKPASLKPFLVWHSVPGAVMYEIELLSEAPKIEGGITASQNGHLYSTSKVFTNGWQADLSQWKNRKELYWRVRALDLQRRPIGEFSKAERIVIDASVPAPTAPLINTFDQMAQAAPPLYPVYQWIPIHNSMRYEVELFTTKPASVSPTEPTPEREWYRIADDSFSSYDEYPRPYAGTYYWRVRAIDKNGKTIGTYSELAPFTVPEQKAPIYAAAFGDSITHGGGAISYSPANLEYSYTTYLDFPALNLGRSGDTAHATMLRFEDDVLPFHPKNLLILTGSNDLRSDLSAQSIIADLDIIRVKCEANGIRPIFLTLMPIHPMNIYTAFRTPSDPNWYAKMKKINEFIRKQEYHIDLEPYFYDKNHLQLETSLSIDGLHPDIRGKMLMAEIINAHKEVLIPR
ncbi:SGNH/GDSL hydrolase family protein [Schwartzia sp. (in: firmicutes)]